MPSISESQKKVASCSVRAPAELVRRVSTPSVPTSGRATTQGNLAEQPKPTGEKLAFVPSRAERTSHHKVRDLPLAREFFIGRRMGQPADDYEITGRIGEGIYGVVDSVRCRQRDALLCMKTINKQNAIDRGMPESLIVGEVDKLKNLDHPSVLRLFHHYADEETLHIVTDLLEGGTLFQLVIDNIIALSPLTENWVNGVFLQVCDGVAYAHTKGFMHKDLKLDNIMLTTSDPPQAVIIDWGLAEAIPVEADTVHSTWNGTLSTMAPEVIMRRFTCKCDVWALGCCLWGLLCRQPTAFRKPNGSIEYHPYPFTPPEGRSGTELDEYLHVQRQGPNINNFRGGKDAQDLLRSLLLYDDGQRPTVQQVLKHPWFANSCCDMVLSPCQLRSLCNFEKTTSFERAALVDRVSHLPFEELYDFSSLFRSFQDATGMLHAAKFVNAMLNAGAEPEVAQAISSQLTRQGPVEFSLFVAALIGGPSSNPPAAGSALVLTSGELDEER